VSDASAIPKEDGGVFEAFGGDVMHYQALNPRLAQVIRVVKEHCAI
jgi:hypothetical protein